MPPQTNKEDLYQIVVHRSFFGACPLASLGVGLLRGSLVLRLAFGETAPSGRPPHPSRRAAPQAPPMKLIRTTTQRLV